MARVYSKYNALVVFADVYQVLVRVYDALGREVYGSEEDPALVVFDTLQGTASAPDAAWTADAVGYNFKYTIPGRGVFVVGGGLYVAEYTLEMADGDTITVSGSLAVAPVQTYKDTQTQ